MKKTRKKLTLHKETLSNLGEVSGQGTSITACPDYSCTYCYERFCATGDTCSDSQVFSWCICDQ